MALLSPEFVNTLSTLLESTNKPTAVFIIWGTLQRPQLAPCTPISQPPQQRPGHGHRRAKNDPTATAAAQGGGRSTGFCWPLTHPPAPATPIRLLPAGRPPAAPLPAGRPAQSVPPRDAGPWLPATRSPGACPSPAIDSPAEPAPPRPSDPPPVLSGSLPEPLSPRLRRSGPEAGRIDFLPRADSHRGKTPQGGGRAAVIHVRSIAAPKRRQKVGRNGTAADRGRALPAPVRPLRSAPRDAHATLADSHRWDAGASRRRGLARPCRMACIRLLKTGVIPRTERMVIKPFVAVSKTIQP